MAANARQRLSCESVARAALGDPVRREGDELLWRCPHAELHRHGDAHPSVKVNTKKDVWACFVCGAKGKAWALAAFIARLDPGDKPAVTAWLREHGLLDGAASGNAPVWRRPVAEFYFGADLRKVRIEPGYDGEQKSFIWEHWEHHDGADWKPGDGGKPKPLYVNKIFHDADQLDYAVGFEGEAKCDLAGELGIPSFSYKELTESECAKLQGLKVILWRDMDTSGTTQVEAAARKIYDFGEPRSIAMIAPPPELPESGDIVDAVRMLHWGRQEIEQIITEAKMWGPPVPSHVVDTAVTDDATKTPDTTTNTTTEPYIDSPGQNETEPDRETDAGNAEYFTALYGHAVRFDHRRRRWLLWKGHRWQQDADAEIWRLAKSAMRQRFKDAAAIEDPDSRSRAAKWSIASESRARLDAQLSLAQAELPIADSGERWDVDPYLLGVRNGVVDLRTGELRPGRPEDRITMQAAVNYDPTAACPEWEKFISEIFDSDPALIQFVQRAVGYSLTGVTTEQCLFLLYGTGANGKGTFTNTLRWVLGDYAWNMPFATIEAKDRAAIPNDLAALVGRRFVVASETNDGTRLNESRIKALTGNDPITARFLHAEYFEFEPVAKFWLSVNHKPIVRDESHGFWRRIRLIPFTKKFPINPNFAGRLRTEAAGILAWAVRSCLDWQRDGLIPPMVVTEATAEYKEDSDPLGDFLAEACTLGPGAKAASSELYGHYSRWAESRSMPERERLTITMFGRKMGERFEKRKEEGRALYWGISLSSLE